MLRVVVLTLLVCGSVLAAGELWQAQDQYVRVEAQEASAAGPHDHPVTLQGRDLAVVFRALQAQQKGGFFRFVSKQPVGVFNAQMARLLGTKLAEGLAVAGADEEVVFVLVGFYRGRVLAGDRRAVGGRAFYRDGQLHLIFGDVLRPADYGKERDLRGFDTEVDRRVYPLHAGSRDREGADDWELLIGEGMDWHDGSRRDWVVLDVPRVLQAVQAMTEDEEGLSQAELRRQRVEMAQMRKRMGAGTVEERLRVLESLREQELVTEGEYRNKRQAILDSL